MVGPSAPPSTSQSASARRTEAGSSAGTHSGTRIWPVGETMLAIACASWMPGLEISPPQLPEWWPPARASIVRSKLKLPREPRKIVGRSARRRGPSEAISRSALNKSVFASHNSRSPGEPVSSPISTRNLALNPRRPRSASTLAIACMLTECWPLLSAMPRPYQRPSRSVSFHGDRPSFHSGSSPRMTSPWP